MSFDQPTPDFLDEIEDGYYETDLRGNFTFVNEAITRITGFSRDDLLNPNTRRYSKHTDSATAGRLRKAFSAVYRSGKPMRSMELPLRTKDGKNRHLDISVSLIRDVDNQPSGFRGFVRDMTERRLIEGALRTRIQLLSMLQQVDSELSHQLDPDAVLMLGMNAAMSISHADSGFIGLVEDGRLRIVRSIGMGEGENERDLDLNEGVIGRALRLGRAQCVTDVAHDPDYIGDLEGMEANIVAPLIARERLIGVLNLETCLCSRFTPEIYEFIQLLTTRLATALDNAMLIQTSQTQLAALQELYTQVSDLERLKTDMIRIAAHDMRSPLSVVANYVDLLRIDLDEHLDLTHRGYFDAIERGLERMKLLSTDVLSLERIHERQGIPNDLIQFDALVREVVANYRGEAKQRELNLKVSVGKMPTFVSGDMLELVEAASNLVANAMKYTPSGGQVTVRVIHAVDKISFEVEDTGFGVPETEQTHLFQPFYRVKTRETVSITGTGLGLYLVKKIIERHGGQVYFESQQGAGSRFGFTLPVAQPSAESAAHTHQVGA